MKVLEAARKVLEEAGEPLHYLEITSRMLRTGVWHTDGKTPEATVNAQLAVDIKRHGEASTFRRVGRGVFGLNDGAPARPASGRRPGGRVRDTEDSPLYLASRRRKRPMSFTAAAEAILKSAGGGPMHYRDLTRHALDHGLLDTQGRTPEATMYAQIITEVKRRQGRGEHQRFMVLGKGMISLARFQAKGLTYQVDEANRKARRELLARIKEMPPGDFEDLVARLLAAIGFEEVEVTARSRDGGIDVRGVLVVGDVIRTRLAVQVKRWKDNVPAPVIQQVRGSLGVHEQGLVIATSDFSRGAREEAERADATPVGLMNGEKLVGLLVENEIGVRRTKLDLIEVGETAVSEE